MEKLLVLLVLLGTIVAGTFPATAEEIPYYASLKSDEVNMRRGPGLRYPIRWVYQREGWPVKVTHEFEHWRKVRDADGTVGWIHHALLSPRRTALITGDARILYFEPRETSSPLVKVEPGVIGEIITCQGSWCQLQVSHYKGWIPGEQLWGAR